MLPMVAMALAGPVRLQSGARMVPWFLGFLVAGATIILAATLALGSSPKGLWNGLIVQPLHLAQVFSYSPGVGIRATVRTLPGMLVGLAYASGLCRSWGLIRVLRVVYAGGVLWFGSLGAGEYLFQVLFYGLSWSWLVLAVEPGADGEDAQASMPISRAALGLATPLLVLLAYPVAGSQIYFAMLPLLVVASVCVADILRSLKRRAWAQRLVVAGVCVISLASLGNKALQSARTYRHGEPLGLPGSSHLRLSAEDVATYRWVAERLHTECDTFVGLPGLNSFYFWAEKPPPTALNAGFWMKLLTDDQQAEIVAALDSRERVMAVRNRELVKFWLRDGAATGPLARYIDSMEVVGRRGEYELLRRPNSSKGAATPHLGP